MEALLSQLHTLDNHSALYILHSLTPLAQFEERRILELFQQQAPGAGQWLNSSSPHGSSTARLDSAQRYSASDWSLQTDNGQTLDTGVYWQVCL